MNHNNIKWESCLGVCTDRARVMAGEYVGFQALIRQKALEIIKTHCLINPESLESQNVVPHQITY